MNADNTSSGSSSGGTSATKPPPPEAPPEKLTEAEYLAQQAHNARLAMSKAWNEMKVRLGQGVSPKVWAQEYPWTTVGAAAVAGFVAATTLVPSKEQQALKKLAAIERALNPPPKTEPANGDGKKEGHGTFGVILHEVLGVVRPALMSLLSAGLTARTMADGQQDPPAGPEEEQQFYTGA